MISKMRLVSKPTRKINVRLKDLANLVQGKDTLTDDRIIVKGIRQVGECMFVRTERGILEAREAVRRRCGGMALCRVS